MAIATFGDLVAPMSEQAFFAEVHGRAPAHIVGAADKFAGVLDWDGLSALVNQSGLWTQKSLELVLDNRKLSAAEYCRPGKDRDNRDNLLCDLDLVGMWLRRGASMVLNDIDSLAPGIKAVAGCLERALGAKVQGNLYCSWQAHQGFGSHFDTHDVYAVHVAGEKTWRLYGRHFEDPIAHPAFNALGHAFHEAHKGPLSQEVTLRPGDLLYIPRGWYHDALATSAATFHIAFGATTVIGIDALGPVFERAVLDPLFRRTMPNPSADRDAFAAHLAALGDRLAAIAREPALVDQLDRFTTAFHYQRTDLRLPDDALERRFRRRSAGIRVFQRNGAWYVGTQTKGAPIPAGLDRPVAWVVDRDRFTDRAFAAAFPALAEAARHQLIDNLVAMKVIEAA